MENTLWEFIYCPCIHESVAATVSIHRTKKGAEIAMEFHKAEALKEFERWTKELSEDLFKFGRNEYWEVREIEIQD